MFFKRKKKSEDIIDLSYLEKKKSFLNKIKKQDYKDLSDNQEHQTPINTSNSGDFFGAVSNSQSSFTSQGNVSNNLEISGIKNKLEDLEYKLDNLRKKIDTVLDQVDVIEKRVNRIEGRN
jgi:seryl-tRNA(Sec) selenium transferase